MSAGAQSIPASFPKPTAVPVAIYSPGYSVSTRGGTVRLGLSFQVSYRTKVESGSAIWQGAPLTLCSSPSGTGKSTLLRELYAHLMRRQAQLSFDFAPVYEMDTSAVGYVPQHAPMVNHWRVSHLLPETPNFLDCFFESQEIGELVSKRVGEFSGGQRRKLYTCSVLERLRAEGASNSFLLLDETFDGLGAAEAGRCIAAVQRRWHKLESGPLQILLVTHLNEAELLGGKHICRKLGLRILRSATKELTVQLFSKQ